MDSIPMTFKGWLRQAKIPDPPKAVAVKLEPTCDAKAIVPTLRYELAKCYLNPADFEDLFQAGGMKRVFDALKGKHFPKDEKTKKGVFGETLAMLWVRDVMGYEVPVLKRQWAMQRERPQLGEDVIGFVFSEREKDRVIIVESKFSTSTKSKLEDAVQMAHQTIAKCMTASQCYALYHISTFLYYTGNTRLYARVKAMFDNYQGKHFSKDSGVFLSTKTSLWYDDIFRDQIKSNSVDNLNCWAIVCEEIVSLYAEVHS